MDLHSLEEFANPMPTLPPNIAMCDRIPRAKWITKCVTLKNEAGMDVANRVYQNINLELVVNMDRKPLGDNRVVVQIVESLCEDVIPSN